MAGLSLPPERILRIRDFSGGLNVRDAVTELAPNESPDLWNVTLDERGGAGKRLGMARVNSTAFGGGPVQNTLYSPTLTAVISQAGASLYKDSVNTARLTFSTSARCGLIEFDAKVWATHPVDGLYVSTDGITWSAVAAGPKGTSLAAWQNRLLSCGDPANPTKVSASAIDDGTNWTISGLTPPAWDNRLDEVDSSPLLGFENIGGVDIAGRPGLVVCKRDSTYRLYSSTDGAYATVDPKIGAASALAMTSLAGRTIIVSRSGVFWTDGGPLVKASKRIDPLFSDAAINAAKLDNWAVGTVGSRVYMSLTRAGATVNDLALEYHPEETWFTAGSNAASCYTTYQKQTSRLYGGSPSASGRVYEMNSGGTDDGAAIDSHFQTRWFEPADGFETSLLAARLLGRTPMAGVTLDTRLDYTTSQGLIDTITIAAGGFTWGTGVWGVDSWGPAVYEQYSDLIPSLGMGRAVSFRISETGSTVATAPQLLGTGVAPTRGAWGLSGIDLKFVQTSTS